MSQDEFEGQNDLGGAPQAPVVIDEEKISNTGQRIRAILVAVIAIAIGVGVVLWYSGREKEKAAHEEVRSLFTKAHNLGFVAFWAKSQIDLKAVKSADDFRARVKTIIAANPAGYGKYLKAKALPVLEAGLPAYKDIKGQIEYSEAIDGVNKAYEAMQKSWIALDEYLLKQEAFLEQKGKLDDAGNNWLGAQGADDEKYLTKAVNYVALVQCILADKVMAQQNPDNLQDVLAATCESDKPGWFKRVAYDCMPLLDRTDSKADPTYTATLETYRKSGVQDTNSVFSINTCVKQSQAALEDELIDAVGASWAGYVKAQNAFVDKIEENLKKLQ